MRSLLYLFFLTMTVQLLQKTTYADRLFPEIRLARIQMADLENHNMERCSVVCRRLTKLYICFAGWNKRKIFCCGSLIRLLAFLLLLTANFNVSKKLNTLLFFIAHFASSPQTYYLGNSIHFIYTAPFHNKEQTCPNYKFNPDSITVSSVLVIIQCTQTALDEMPYSIKLSQTNPDFIKLTLCCILPSRAACWRQ